MIYLNLVANTQEEMTVKEHLQEMVNETLAEKINNGVIIEKDGKRLLNKKDLQGFVEFAKQETEKTIAEKKGTVAVCVNGQTIMNWAIHYFEEDSIEGKLYNEDGTEYTPPKPVQRTPAPIVTTPKPQPKPQMSLFDLIPQAEEQPQPAAIKETDDEEPTEEEIHDAMDELAAEEQRQELEQPKPTCSPVYQKYMDIQNKYPDAIVVYRLGDFYEVFGDNAKTIANELDLTLTGRDCGLAERVPMIGFPYHAADAYIQKIVDCGYKVAVTENLNDVRISEPAPIKEETDDGKHWIDDKTYVDDEGEVHNVDEEEELKQALEFAKAFDKNALAILYEIFNNEIDLQ